MTRTNAGWVETVGVLWIVAACSTSGLDPLAGGTTGGGTTAGGTPGGGTTAGTTTGGTILGLRAVDASVTTGTAVSTTYGGSCNMLTRDTNSCLTARTALGLSGNWLQFSCNVSLSLATASNAPTSTYSNASYVVVTFHDLPDYASNYYPTTGSYSFTANEYTVSGTYDALHQNYTTAFPDPSNLAQQTVTMNIPIAPAASSGAQTMSLGMVGVAINGVAIYNNLAAGTDNIFAEAGSFDQCQGHPSPQNGGTYHYHSEPYAISYDDNHLIGVMRDGYFIYGRQDSDASHPGTIAALETAGTSSTLYKYGGHAGADPITGTGSTFHYHLTEWEGCFHESGSVKSSDDGDSNDTLNTPAGTCNGSWVDGWFMTGRGNGGVFDTVPGGIGTQSPSQNTAGVRYYYGTPGMCSGC